MQFVEQEQRDGARFAWNVFPTSRIEAARMAVPLGCMYTPLKQIPGQTQAGRADRPCRRQPGAHTNECTIACADVRAFLLVSLSPSLSPGLIQVPYHPVVCKAASCGTILNAYSRVDFLNKIWVCPLCLTRNHFPHHYADISSENRPAEIMPQYTTIEYVIEPTQRAPVFLFVIDTCIVEEELKQIKTSLFQSLLLLPQDSLVGLVTFGRNVHIHELSFEDVPKSYVFRGDKDLTAAQIANFLGLRATAVNQQQSSQAGPGQQPQQQQAGFDARKATGRFLMPVADCEYQLTQILEGLTKDAWPYKNTERPQRCTGTALSVAVSLLETIYKDSPGRIMTFVGGPPTIGPGMIVSTDLKEHMRSHHDLHKGNAPFYKPAIKFYEGVASRAVANGHTIDLFACSLDQVGLAEMKICVEKTGGYLVLDDSFTRGVFIGSFKRVFARDNAASIAAAAAAQAAAAAGQPPPPVPEASASDLVMSFNGELTVLTSREFKVCGAVGNVTSLDRKSSSVSETELGVGGTCAWTLGGLDGNSTLALYFEIVNQSSDAPAPNPDGSVRQCYMQFVTKYRHSTGRTHLRVSTISKTFADSNPQGLAYIRAGFDQEAAAVLITRLAVHKTLSEYTFDILRWVDRTLIRLVAKFASYKKDDPNTFRLSPEFSYYPQFMFHLRRSQFLQVFNSSPDETAFFRSILLRETVTNSLIMIQPTLMAYSLEGPAEPDILDVSSCAPNRILVLDTFFHLVIWYGDTIAKWQADGIHLKPEYDYFAQLLRAPKTDAQVLMDARFPYPRFIECVEKGSQSRFLMAKLNPSITQSNAEYQQGGEPPGKTREMIGGGAGRTSMSKPVMCAQLRAHLSLSPSLLLSVSRQSSPRMCR